MKKIFLFFLFPSVAMAQIDTSMYANIKTIDGAAVYKEGLELADIWLERQVEAAHAKLYKQADGDLYKMLELSKNHKLSRWLTPKIQTEIDEQEIRELERLKRLLEIQKLQNKLSN